MQLLAHFFTSAKFLKPFEIAVEQVSGAGSSAYNGLYEQASHQDSNLNGAPLLLLAAKVHTVCARDAVDTFLQLLELLFSEGTLVYTG